MVIAEVQESWQYLYKERVDLAALSQYLFNHFLTGSTNLTWAWILHNFISILLLISVNFLQHEKSGILRDPARKRLFKNKYLITDLKHNFFLTFFVNSEFGRYTNDEHINGSEIYGRCETTKLCLFLSLAYNWWFVERETNLVRRISPFSLRQKIVVTKLNKNVHITTKEWRHSPIAHVTAECEQVFIQTFYWFLLKNVVNPLTTV